MLSQLRITDLYPACKDTVRYREYHDITETLSIMQFTRPPSLLLLSVCFLDFETYPEIRNRSRSSYLTVPCCSCRKATSSMMTSSPHCLCWSGMSRCGIWFLCIFICVSKWSKLLCMLDLRSAFEFAVRVSSKRLSIEGKVPFLAKFEGISGSGSGKDRGCSHWPPCTGTSEWRRVSNNSVLICSPLSSTITCDATL